jgi:hypothetical protein
VLLKVRLKHFRFRRLVLLGLWEGYEQRMVGAGAGVTQELARHAELGYEEAMSYGDSFIGKNKLPTFTGKARPEEMHLYSLEAEAELIEDVHRMGKRLLDDWKGSHHPDLWPELAERCKGIEQKWIGQIRLSFFQKRARPCVLAARQNDVRQHGKGIAKPWT